MDENLTSNNTLHSSQPALKTTKNNHKQRLLKIFIPLIIIAFSIGVLVLMKQMAPVLEKKAVELKVPLVDAITLEKKSVPFIITSQGSVLASQNTLLTAEVSGKVTQLADNFKEGSFFKKGQRMATIDDSDYQIMLLQAKARLAQANAALLEEQARNQQAKEEWQLSGKPLDKAPLLALRKPQLAKAQADVSLAEADIQSAQLKLQRTNIIAPYNGIIKSKNIDIAQYVNAGTQLGEIIATDVAEIRLPIKQQDINFLALPKIDHARANTPITLLQNNQQWQATLARTEGIVDDQNRVYYVVAELNDPYALKSETTPGATKPLPIGSFVNAQLKGKTFENITYIPRRYVVGKNTLYLIDQSQKLVIKSFSVLRADQHYLYSQDDFSSELKLITTKLTLPVAGMQLRLSSQASERTSSDLNQVAN